MKRLLAVLSIIAAMTGMAQAECYQPWNARYDLRSRWLKADCNFDFPPRNGFAGRARMVRLKPGTLIDRFGHPGGYFLAPADASYMGRAVPYDRLKTPYYRYEVVRPLRVAAGRTAPWFDQSGGGMQYKTDRRVQVLVNQGTLKQVW